MTDILLVTIECARWDYRDELSVFDDLNTVDGIATGNYTRPSLAALHSGQFDAAAETRVQSPTIADKLGNAGFDTAAFSYSPQTAPQFGFARGFDRYEGVDADGIGRGSRIREWLGSLGPARQLYRRLQSKNATLADIPRDSAVCEQAVEHWQSMASPRFLWVHLMGSHRPYGWDNGLPADVGRRAAEVDGMVDDQVTVVGHYVNGLQRTGTLAHSFVERINPDVTVVAGDHGEELGEHGRYFHAPFRQRLVDELVHVPIGVRGVDVSGPLGLVDVPALLADAAGVGCVGWDSRVDRDWQLSLAPWNGDLRWRLQSDSVDLRVGDGVATTSTRGVTEQLAALGYR